MEQIIFFVCLDLQMKPYRTDEYVHKLFYETSRFSAFNHQWVVKSRINNSARDPHTVNERQITYQVWIWIDSIKSIPHFMNRIFWIHYRGLEYQIFTQS